MAENRGARARLLLINPNTSPETTELVAGHAGRLAGPGTEIRPATGRFGARYIATRAAAAIAAHAALDAFAEHGGDCDAVFLACFGDPGLDALKELSPVPVVGMAEASCQAACALGRRFSIVTGGRLWKAMLEEFVCHLGLSERLASVRCTAPTGGEIARDPEAAVPALAEACRAAAESDAADVVILGGAGLAGLASRIAHQVPVPIVCSVEAGLRASLTAAARRRGAAGVGRDVPSVESIGLSPPLANLLLRTPSSC